MLEKMYALFGWTNAQKESFGRFLRSAEELFTGKHSLKRFFALFLVTVELFGAAVFKAPVHPRGEALDLDGYELVMFDDFDGDELDMNVWYHRGSGPSRCGFHAASQASVSDGKLYLTGEYLDEQTGEFGAGWYTASVALRQWYYKGYFEISCICNKDDGFWSAFWMQSNHSYDLESRGGIGGAEIDIFEASDYDALLPINRNSVTQTVYCNGSDEDDENIDKCQFSAVGDDIYNKFNTYGLKWTDDEYIFYINGKETVRTSFGLGVSEVLENLIVSLEVPEKLPEKITSNRDYKTQMIVDYVKVYQPTQA
ncbi:MAG: glycoside hydrolase family 16 protein [Clostridia bacterium]|nr:glycoside hydrolase family 16 protein [Clostridia bacterium]